MIKESHGIMVLKIELLFDSETSEIQVLIKVNFKQSFARGGIRSQFRDISIFRKPISKQQFNKV